MVDGRRGMNQDFAALLAFGPKPPNPNPLTPKLKHLNPLTLTPNLKPPHPLTLTPKLKPLNPLTPGLV